MAKIVKILVYKIQSGEKLFLLLQQPSGFWRMPAGELVPDETQQEALARIVRESLTLEPEDYKIVGEMNLASKVFLIQYLHQSSDNSDAIKPYRFFGEEKSLPDQPFRWLTREEVLTELNNDRDELEDFVGAAI